MAKSRNRRNIVDVIKEAEKQQEENRKHNQRILNQINTKQQEVNRIGGLQSRLRNCKQNIEGSTRRYERKQKSFQNNSSTGTVVVKNKFEGRAAQEIRNRNQQFIGSIGPKVSQADNIAALIPAVQSYLGEYKANLEAEIQSLRGELR